MYNNALLLLTASFTAYIFLEPHLDLRRPGPRANGKFRLFRYPQDLGAVKKRRPGRAIRLLSRTPSAYRKNGVSALNSL